MRERRERDGAECGVEDLSCPKLPGGHDPGQGSFFSAPCGFGKSTTGQALVANRKVCSLSAWDQVFVFPPADDSRDTLVLDDLQFLVQDRCQNALCELIRNHPERWFVLLSRGIVSGWLLPFQFAGVMTVFDCWDLALDQESTGSLLRQYGFQASDLELMEIQKVTKGCPMALILLIHHLLRGEKYSKGLADQVRRELILYFEERVFFPLDLNLQELLLDLAPFASFGPELARIVSGNTRAGESRFFPNLDAMLCRVSLYLGDDSAVSQWYREKAPKDPRQLYGLKRYQYYNPGQSGAVHGEGRPGPADDGPSLPLLSSLPPAYRQHPSRHSDSHRQGADG